MREVAHKKRVEKMKMDVVSEVKCYCTDAWGSARLAASANPDGVGIESATSGSLSTMETLLRRSSIFLKAVGSRCIRRSFSFSGTYAYNSRASGCRKRKMNVRATHQGRMRPSPLRLPCIWIGGGGTLTASGHSRCRYPTRASLLPPDKSEVRLSVNLPLLFVNRRSATALSFHRKQPLYMRWSHPNRRGRR